jgi:hypothetical protein
MNKFYLFVGALGMTSLSLIPYGCGDKGSKETQEVPKQYSAPVVKDTIKQEPSNYVVQKGDFLSSIMYNELGLRGDNIYKKLLKIQPLNWSAEEIKRRDLGSGPELSGEKDGLADLIYPNEKIRLN